MGNRVRWRTRRLFILIRVVCLPRAENRPFIASPSPPPGPKATQADTLTGHNSARPSPRPALPHNDRKTRCTTKDTQRRDTNSTRDVPIHRLKKKEQKKKEKKTTTLLFVCVSFRCFISGFGLLVHTAAASLDSGLSSLTPLQCYSRRSASPHAELPPVSCSSSSSCWC